MTQERPGLWLRTDTLWGVTGEWHFRYHPCYILVAFLEHLGEKQVGSKVFEMVLSSSAAVNICETAPSKQLWGETPLEALSSLVLREIKMASKPLRLWTLASAATTLYPRHHCSDLRKQGLNLSFSCFFSAPGAVWGFWFKVLLQPMLPLLW